MAKKRGGNITVSNTSTPLVVTVNSGTSTTLVPADNQRTYLEISNPSNQDVWIKLQAASVDNIKTGILLPPSERWRMGDNDKYTGEVSAIMNIGGSKDIHITEM